ncbi:hypothetical protein Bca4012_025811 [Brassica carinata]
MEIEHCMHELIPFLDKLCAMSRLLVLRVNHPLKNHLNFLFHFASMPFPPNQMTWTI